MLRLVWDYSHSSDLIACSVFNKDVARCVPALLASVFANHFVLLSILSTVTIEVCFFEVTVTLYFFFSFSLGTFSTKSESSHGHLFFKQDIGVVIYQ